MTKRQEKQIKVRNSILQRRAKQTQARINKYGLVSKAKTELPKVELYNKAWDRFMKQKSISNRKKKRGQYRKWRV